MRRERREPSTPPYLTRIFFGGRPLGRRAATHRQSGKDA